MWKTRLWLATALLVSTVPFARAQPEEDEPDDTGQATDNDDQDTVHPRGLPDGESEETEATGESTDNSPTPPDAEPVPEPVSPPPAQPTTERIPRAPDRPTGFSLGVGAGYALPADLQTPNVASVRFRLPGGVTLEPQVTLRTDASTTSFMGNDTTNTTSNLSLGSSLRYPLLGRGPVDLLLVGGGAFGYSVTDPDGPDNATRTTTLSLFWGLGLEYWISSQWVISLTATNPLLLLTRQKQNLAGEDQTMTSRSIGVVFNPAVVAMVHLFF